MRGTPRHGGFTMKRKLTVVFVIIAAIIFAFGITACSERDLSGKKTVTIVNGSFTETKEYDVGATITLTPNVAQGQEFEYWEVNGERYSTEKNLVYKVTTDVTIRGVFSDAVRTVQIISGENNRSRAYAYGTKIALSADLVADMKFVCWVANDKPLSYERNAEYVVTEDAVVRAVYASDKKITLSYNGGKADNQNVTVTAFGSTASYDGALLSGYDYSLPVPVKDRHKFVCWEANGKKVTDKNGVSLEPYDGTSTLFVAVYEENPYVYVVIKNGGTGEEQRKFKAYVEDGSVEIKADEITDMACFGWELSYTEIENGTEKEIKQNIATVSSFYFDLNRDFVKANKTYTFSAKYREAYKVTVVSGGGSGSYGKNEDIVLIGAVPTGKNFLDWTIAYGGKTAVLARTGDGSFCLVYEEDGGEKKAVYYSEKEKTVVTVAAADVSAKSIPESGSFTLAELEKLGVKIEGGSNTLIRGRFEDKDYLLTYTLNCNINGKYFLDEDMEKAIIGAGFEKRENGIFVKEEHYNYNDGIMLAKVPEMEHYEFGQWQSVGEGKTPSNMPNRNVQVTGSFSARRYLVDLSGVMSEYGEARIGGSSGVKSGSYAYGSIIEFYVVAFEGYEFSKWKDTEEIDASDRIKSNAEPVKGERITYSFVYTVQGNEKFTCVFQNRGYTITYIFNIIYDGTDVTNDETFFMPGTYKEGYAKKVVSKKYGEKVTLDDKYTIKGGENAAYDLALKFEAKHWTVSDWVADGEGLDVSGEFSMPKKDVVVRSVCTIKSHNVTISLKEGIKPEIKTINGNSPEKYKYGADSYIVPYGAKFVFSVSLEKGCSIDGVQANGKTLDAEEGYSYVENSADRYKGEATFALVSDADNVVYSFSSKQNEFTITYYVRTDYEQNDEENPLSACAEIDKNEYKLVDGEKYYKLNKLLVGQDEYLRDATITGLVYNDSVSDALINATKARYDFGGWSRMFGDKPYSGATMPDGDIWAYGTLNLRKYSVTLEKETFRFDGNAGMAINTAEVKKIVEGGSETNYDDGEYTASKRLYFSEYTIKRHSPTGYDFTKWRITAGTNINDYAEFTVTGAEIGKILSVTAYSGRYTFKYMVNGNDTITLFLTDDCKIKAGFSVKTFTATSKDETQIAVDGSEEYATAISFEYGSALKIKYSCRDMMMSGRKVTAFVISDASDATAEKETIPTGFDEETLSYPYGTETSPEARGRTKQYTNSVEVVTEKEDIDYRIYYTVYTAADSLKSLNNRFVTTCQDNDGAYYTVKLKQTVSLATEERVKQIAAAEGLEYEGAMFSGWYDKNALLSTDAEGEGFKENGANPDGTWKYTHEKKSNKAPSHVYLSCYLIRLVKTYEGEGKLNGTIKDTPNYSQYFRMHYNEITVPEKGSDGKNVVTIANEAFKGMRSLVKVTLPNTITTIGASAFEGCISLAETGLTDAVVEIGGRAYSGCSAISEVYLGENVHNIGAKAFEKTSNLTNIFYNSAQTVNHSIGINVFDDAGENTSGITLTIGSAVTVVPKGLFGGSNEKSAKYLSAVVFEQGKEKSVTIGEGAFAYSGMRTLEPNGRLRSIKSSAFEGCKNFTEFDFEGSGLTAVDASAFANSKLKTVILSEEITSIGVAAFSNCMDLESVYYRGENGITVIEERAFAAGGGSATSAISAIRRFTSITERDKETPADEIKLPNTVTLGKQAFYGAAEVKTVYLGGKKAYIGVSVFEGARGIKNITYDVENGGDVSSTDSSPFMNMQSIGDVAITIGSNVKRVPARMFYNVGSVKKIAVPSNVASIGAYAFAHMNALSEIDFEINGDDYEMSSAANPFYGSGAESGITVRFGNNVTKIKENAFSKTEKLTRFVIAADADKPLVIGASAFAETGVTTVNIPVRQSLSVGKYAFRGASINSVAINEDVSEISVDAYAFSSIKGKINTIRAFGKSMNGVWFVAENEDGAVNAVKTGTGIKATINGAMKTNGSVTVEKGDELVVATGAKLNIAAETTIKGKFTPETGSNVEKKDESVVFRAIAFAKDDFGEKNAYAEYTHRVIAADMDFTENLVVNGEEFSINEGAKVTFSGDSYELSVNTFKVVTETDSSCTMSGKTLNAKGRLVGKIRVTENAAVTVGGKKFFNDGVDLSATDSGLRVTSGTTELYSNGSRFTYTVVTGELRINTEGYTQNSSYGIGVKKDATLAVDFTATLSTYTAESGSFLAIEDDAVLRLKEYGGAASGVKWTVSAAVSALGNNVKSYFGSLEKGFNDSANEKRTIVLERSATYDEFNVQTPKADTTLDFNGYTLSIKNGGMTLFGNLRIQNADFKATENGGAIIRGQADTGYLFVESGTIKAKNNAIDAKLHVTVGSGAEIISEEGVALMCDQATINGAVRGKTYGLLMESSAIGAKAEIGGVVESVGGTAVKIVGQALEVKLLGTGSITGKTALYISETGEPSDSDAALVAEAGSVIAGTDAGAILVGTGKYVLKGGVTATAERGVNAENNGLYKGAIVIVEKDKGQAGNNVSAELTATATAKNENGDAILYVGYDREEVLNDGTARKTLELSTATIIGRKAALVQAFDVKSGASDDAEQYSLVGDEIVLYKNAAEFGTGDGVYEYNGSRTRIFQNCSVLSLEVATGTLSTVRYVTEHTDVAEALNFSNYVRVIGGGLTYVGDVKTEKTLVVAQDLAWSNGNVSGTLGIVGGAVTARGNVSASGRIIGVKSALEGKELIVGGAFSVTKTAEGNYGTIDLTSGMTINESASANFFRRLALSEKGVIENYGTISIGNDVYDQYETDIEYSSLSGKVEVLGGKIILYEDAYISELTLTDATVEIRQNGNATMVNPKETEITTKIVSVYGNDVVLGGKFTINEKLLLGANTEFTEKVVINGSVALSDERQPKTLTLSGADNEISIEGTTRYDADINGDTKFFTKKSNAMFVYGKIKVRAKIEVKINNAEASKYGQLVITGDDVGEGRIVLQNGADVHAEEFYLMNGGGAEHYFGTLTVHKVSFEMGTNLAVSGVFIDNRGWMFVGSADKLEENSFIGYDNGTNTGKVKSEDIKTVKYEYEIFGKTSGFVVSNCTAASYKTHSATCGEEGGDRCIYEYVGTLEDGTKIEIRHERKNVTPATGLHTFIPKADGSGHYCSVCGWEEQHTYEKKNLSRLGNACFVDDANENALGVYGESCDYCAHKTSKGIAIADASTTIKQFNAMNYMHRVEILDNGERKRVFVKVNFAFDKDEPLIKYAERKLVYLKKDDLTVDKTKKYYAIPIDVDSEPDTNYILVEHTDGNHYYICENGKHVCIGCGEEAQGEQANHEYDSTKETFIDRFAGTDYYAIEYVCPNCGDSNGILNVGQHDGDTQIASMQNEINAQYNVTIDATSGTVGDNYLFMFVFGGIEYFGVAATRVGSEHKIIIGVKHNHNAYVYDGTSGKYVCATDGCKAAYSPEHACEERGTLNATSFGQDGLPGYTFGYVDRGDKVLTHACARCTREDAPSVEFTVVGDMRTAEDLNEALKGYAFFIDGKSYFARANVGDVTTPLTELRARTERVLNGDETLKVAYDLIYVVLVDAETGKTLSVSTTGSYTAKINHICNSYQPYNNGTSIIHRCSSCGKIADIGAHEADETKPYVVANYFGRTVLGRPCKRCDTVVPVTFDLGQQQIEYESYGTGEQTGYRAKNNLVTAMRANVSAINAVLEKMVGYDGRIISNATVTPRFANDIGRAWRDDAMFRAYNGMVTMDDDGMFYDLSEGYDGTLYNVFYVSFATTEGRSEIMAEIFVKHVCSEFISGTTEETATEHYCAVEQCRNRRCSKLYESEIARYNGENVYVKYDDCNPFGMIAGKFGNIENLTKHTTKTPSADTIEKIKTLSTQFATFMSHHTIPTDGTEYAGTVSLSTLSAFSNLYQKAIDVYKGAVATFDTEGGDYNKSVVVGANYPYVITRKADTVPETVDLQAAIANLYGFSDKEEFMNYAKDLVAEYNRHRANVAAGSATTNEALDNGCFYTDNGSFVFPIAVRNETGADVLTYLILSSDGLASVWINDVTVALQAINYSEEYHCSTNSVTNELLCKDTLFVWGEVRKFESEFELKHEPQTQVIGGRKENLYRYAFVKGVFGENYEEVDLTVVERSCLICGGGFENVATVTGKNATLETALNKYIETYATNSEVDSATGKKTYYLRLDGKEYRIGGIVKPWTLQDGEDELMSEEDMRFYRPTGKTTDDGTAEGAQWNNEAVPLVAAKYYAWEVKAFERNNESITKTFRILVLWTNPEK